MASVRQAFCGYAKTKAEALVLDKEREATVVAELLALKAKVI